MNISRLRGSSKRRRSVSCCESHKIRHRCHLGYGNHMLYEEVGSIHSEIVDLEGIREV